MKKMVLSALMLLLCGTLAAQNPTAASLQQAALKYLHDEGYPAKIDEDNDIECKIQGYTYWICLSDESDGSVFVNSFGKFTCDTPYNEVLELCNKKNNEKKAVKYGAGTIDDTTRQFILSYERYQAPGDDFEAYLRDMVALLPAMLADFISEL